MKHTDDINKNTQLEFVREEISNKYRSSTFFSRNFGSHYYVEINEVSNSKFEQLSDVYEKSFIANNKKYSIVLVYISFLLIAVVIKDSKKIQDLNIHTPEFWFCVFSFPLALYLIFYTFFKQKKIFLETSKDYLRINSKTKLYWKDILTTGILTVNFRNGIERRVVVGTTNKIVVINRENSDLLPDDIIQLIKLNVEFWNTKK